MTPEIKVGDKDLVTRVKRGRAIKATIDFFAEISWMQLNQKHYGL